MGKYMLMLSYVYDSIKACYVDELSIFVYVFDTLSSIIFLLYLLHV